MAFSEDLPNKDVTIELLDIESRKVRARIVAKEDLVLSGQAVAAACLRRQDPNVEIDWLFADGSMVLKDQNIAQIWGDWVGLIQAERVALNFLGQLSGIASLTRAFVKKIEHTRCKILDTRKIIPGLRTLAKKAVLDGGGHNHRKNLSDQILIKENHVRFAGGIEVALVRATRKKGIPIIVEVTHLEELKSALRFPIKRVLLDNFTNDQIREAIAIVPASIEVEASGNMNMDRIASVAELGVHYISVGAITHSAPCADLSMLI